MRSPIPGLGRLTIRQRPDEFSSFPTVFGALYVDDLTSKQRRFLQKVEEFKTYIAKNQSFITNYGERYRNGERISTGFVESTVNQVISKRMVKKQQMRWSRQGAHRLLQVRTRVLDDDWRDTFDRWYSDEEVKVA